LAALAASEATAVLGCFDFEVFRKSVGYSPCGSLKAVKDRR